MKASLARGTAPKWKLTAESNSQAAHPTNQIQAVFRIASAAPALDACKGRFVPGGGLKKIPSTLGHSAFLRPRREILSQRTFSIVKPDAVRKGHTAAILAEIEKAGFKIVAIKRMSISRAQAEGFYHVHAARPFFGELTEFMSSGPIFPMVLEKDNAIADLRTLMGATDPAKADAGTIRKKFAASIGENAIHGSDAEDTAAFEIGYFFAGIELK
jgi:nucleoside-diphosphate kinase